MPDVTGITRLQLLGLDFGPRSPAAVRRVRDHHVDLDDVFLHRTVRMPPLDAVGVAPVAAFVAFCSLARVIDAIKVGDWLLHDATWTGTSCTSSRSEQPVARWRRGSALDAGLSGR